MHQKIISTLLWSPVLVQSLLIVSSIWVLPTCQAAKYDSRTVQNLYHLDPIPPMFSTLQKQQDHVVNDDDENHGLAATSTTTTIINSRSTSPFFLHTNNHANHNYNHDIPRGGGTGSSVSVGTTASNNSRRKSGGWFSNVIPAGYNPFGYKITPLGEEFLEFSGSLDSDIGRFIASVKDRKTFANIKSQWLEIVRVSKTAQTMRIYRTLQEIIDFCLKAGFIN